MTIQNSNPEGERGRLPEQPEGQVQSEHVRNDGLNLSFGHDPAICWWCRHPANHNAPLSGIPEYIGGEELPNLQFIKSIPSYGPRLYEAFNAVQKQTTRIEAQGNLNATGDPPVSRSAQ